MHSDGLSSDGTLQTFDSKAAIGCPNDSSLSEFSTTTPTGRLLFEFPPSCPQFAVVANDRVAVIDRARHRSMLYILSASGARRAVADVGPGGMLLGPFDFDGRQIAYALRSCDNRAEILVAPADGAPIMERVLCPGRVPSRVTTLRAGRERVPLALNCTRGCTGRLRIARRAKRRGHPRIALGRYTNFVYPPARQSHRIDAPLSFHARRLVRQARRLPATVELQLNDRAQRTHVKRRRVLIHAEALEAMGLRE